MTTLYALHGFLGRAHDWDDVTRPLDARVRAIDLWPSFDAPVAMATWAKRFNEAVRTDDASGPRVLLGYSMGGRLALHCLVDDPTMWTQAIVVSANPGLTGEPSRRARLVHDRGWAARFRRDPWDELIADWNAQPVFAHRPGPERVEGEIGREHLAAALDHWSVGRQDNLLPALAPQRHRLAWWVGAQDTKYVALTQSKAFTKTGIQARVFDGAAHRIPWEVPDAFAAALRQHVMG